MRIKDELFGKEVLDADVQIVGKVSDVVFDKETFEVTDLVLKKTGISEQITGQFAANASRAGKPKPSIKDENINAELEA